uniref:Uncharacterized protein n=2 Tax=Neisseria meningitidis TaxID=487 RepID=I4E4Z8_NEIME|nr:hypothetical protein predicted by Glimmer/Critica [Neisseria meningitidis alpha153]CCA44414.1 hypothetical protein NMALPHA522_0873 [Neisseria meningitidis alpha522]
MFFDTVLAGIAALGFSHEYPQISDLVSDGIFAAGAVAKGRIIA